MKKLFSSVFIVLILLNVMGYYGLLLGFKYQNAREMMKQFDAGNYNADETILIKIPFKAPGFSDSETFERVDGDFERHGEVYRLIKQRLYRDTFRIVCIRDKRGTAINKALSDYVKTFRDASSENNHSSRILPFFIKEYFARNFSIQPLASGWKQTLSKELLPEIFTDHYTASIIHPPERG